MSDVYDIKTGKKVNINTKTSAQKFRERDTKCLLQVAEKGFCVCDVCVAKDYLADKLYILSSYLLIDYTNTSGNELYTTDWIDVIKTVEHRIKDEIENKK